MAAKRRTRRGSRERLPTAAPLDQGHFWGGFADIKAKMAAAATRPPIPPSVPSNPPTLTPAPRPSDDGGEYTQGKERKGGGGTEGQLLRLTAIEF